jgi:hypothetical protein
VIWGVNDWKNAVIKSKAKSWAVKQQSQSYRLKEKSWSNQSTKLNHQLRQKRG